MTSYIGPMPPYFRRLAAQAARDEATIAALAVLTGKSPAVIVATVASTPYSLGQFYGLILSGRTVPWVEE